MQYINLKKLKYLNLSNTGIDNELCYILGD